MHERLGEREQAAALARSLLHAYPGHPVSQDLIDMLDTLDPSRPVAP
jgi:hypothetical protein